MDDMAARSMYTELILDHYRRPHNKGVLSSSDFSAHVNNPLCGDSLSLQLLCEGEKISHAMFTGSGCALSIAGASLLTDYLKGKTLTELRSLTSETMRALLGIQVLPVRLPCVLLSLRAAQEALSSTHA